MPDIRHTCVLVFAPVMCEQKPAASFGEPIDLKRSPAIPRSLQQAFLAEAKKISMEPVTVGEWQTTSNLMGVMPAPVSERLEYQTLQFAALPHKRILPVYVSTLLFVMGNVRESQKNKGNSKNLHFATRSRA